MKIIVVLFAILLVGSYVSALEHPMPHKRATCHYSYDDSSPDGPSHWSEVCADSEACNSGSQQSPIDIITDSNFNEVATPLNATYVSKEDMTFSNLGHTVQIDDTSDKTLGISGGPLSGFYYLKQAHFHNPSEHTFNGASYPLELHLVHSNEDGSQLAVLGFFFEHSVVSNAFLEQLGAALNDIQYKDNQTTVNAHLELLLSSVGGGYYHYSGSLTTPPCSEIVTWLFSEIVLKATPQQIAKFANIMTHNSRPIQPLHDRVLYYYSEEIGRAHV